MRFIYRIGGDRRILNHQRHVNHQQFLVMIQHIRIAECISQKTSKSSQIHQNTKVQCVFGSTDHMVKFKQTKCQLKTPKKRPSQPQEEAIFFRLPLCGIILSKDYLKLPGDNDSSSTGTVPICRSLLKKPTSKYLTLHLFSPLQQASPPFFIEGAIWKWATLSRQVEAKAGLIKGQWWFITP